MSWVVNMPVLHKISVENAASYMFNRFLSIPRILSMLGLEFTMAVSFTITNAKVTQVLCGYAGFCKLYFKDSRLFWMS